MPASVPIPLPVNDTMTTATNLMSYSELIRFIAAELTEVTQQEQQGRSSVRFAVAIRML